MVTGWATERDRQPDDEQVSVGPNTAFEMVTRRGLEDLGARFASLEAKVNGVLVGVILTFGLEVWKSLR